MRFGKFPNELRNFRRRNFRAAATRNGTATPSTPVNRHSPHCDCGGLLFFIALLIGDCPLRYTNERNTKERPPAEVAVSDFFSEKKSRNISLQSFSSRWLPSLWSLWRLNTTTGSDTPFEKLKRYLAYQRNKHIHFLFSSPKSPLFLLVAPYV